MILDHFEHITIISLPQHKDRLERLRGQLKGHARASRVSVQEAIPGDKLPAPAWWGQGNGSWGCLQSHVRALQDAWQEGHAKTLILEDDAVFDPSAVKSLETLFRSAPAKWGQMYLGGQHQADPVVKSGHFLGKSVNRTHAYAVQHHAIPKILQHIQHYPDHQGWRHVDHQLEVAHMRGDWPVVCPLWWAFGQGENRSSINGGTHPEKWWDWCGADTLKAYPWVIVMQQDSARKIKPYLPRLHFGWTVSKDGRTDAGIQSGMARRTRSALADSARAIAGEAWSMRRLPAVCVKDETQRTIFIETVNPELVALPDAAGFNFKQWAEEQV